MSKNLKNRTVAAVIRACVSRGVQAALLLWQYHPGDKRIMFSAHDSVHSRREHTYMHSWESTGTPEQVRERQIHEIRRILKPVVRFFGV